MDQLKDFLENVREALHIRPPKPVHKLKWKLPEVRMSFPVEDAEKAVLRLKKAGAAFVSGGEFIDAVYAKTYGEGVFAYFIVRTEKKTENEHLLFDGYMIQEEEPLGMNLTSSFSVMEDLEGLGYKNVLSRSVTEWRLSLGVIKVAVFDIDGFGSFLEVALPATKLDSARKIQEKKVELLLKKTGFKQEEALPTDVITLQLLSEKQEEGKKS